MFSWSRTRVKSFPPGVHDDFGYSLYVAQLGEMSPKAKPLHGLGSGVMEIVANEQGGTWRAVYTVSIGDSIYVVHAFRKKAKTGIATAMSEIELVRQRLKQLRSEVKNAEKRTLGMENGSGNVFADLGLADAGEHLIKAGLVVRIDRTIRHRRLTQATAAALMGIDQPKVSAILAGQFRGYSVERLMRFLVALGHDVEIVVKPVRRRPAELRVA